MDGDLDGAGGRRPQPPEVRRICQSITGNRANTMVEGKRRAKYLAVRPLNEAHPTPALRAKRPLLPRDFVAAKTSSWKEHISDPPRHTCKQFTDQGHGNLHLAKTETRYNPSGVWTY